MAQDALQRRDVRVLRGLTVAGTLDLAAALGLMRDDVAMIEAQR
jgi:hypothetical protein